MATLKNRRKVESGKLFDAYFLAAENGEMEEVIIEMSFPFGRGKYEVLKPCFDWNGKTYAVLGYDHFNGHISGFSDRAAVFSISIAECVF